MVAVDSCTILDGVAIDGHCEGLCAGSESEEERGC